METNQNPIHPKVGSIFIHVHDMNRAVHWYAKVLGVSVDTELDGMIHSMPLDNLVLLFDAHHSATFQPSSHPIFSFPTQDIDKTYELLKGINVEFVGEIERFPDISFGTIRDSEGNLIMIVEEK